MGSRILPREDEAAENLARYIFRASFFQERMTYLPEESKVIWESKDGKEEKVFDIIQRILAIDFPFPGPLFNPLMIWHILNSDARFLPAIVDPQTPLRLSIRRWKRKIWREGQNSQEKTSVSS